METGSRAMEALLGLIVVGVFGLFVWLSLAVGTGAPSDASRYVLLFDSALGLTEDNTVAIAGVKVGVVESIGIEGRRAKVTIAIDPEIALHENAVAAVRAKSLLGEKYLDLDPGEPPAPTLAAGATLDKNAPTVEIDQLIRSAAELVASLNVIAPPLEKAIGRLDEMLESADGQQLTGELTRTLADAGKLIRETSSLVEASSKDLQFLLRVGKDRAPEILQKVEQAAEQVDKILAAVDPDMLNRIASKVDPAVENASVALEDLKVAMADIRDASARLDNVLIKVSRALDRTEEINERNIREFFQVQGVRVNLIPDARVERRIQKLKDDPSPVPVP